MDDTRDGLLARVHELETEVAVLQERLSNGNEAVKLQALEYERRLTTLNHAHEQQVQRNLDYVSRETWEQKNVELEKWQRGIDQWKWTSLGIGGLTGAGLAALVNKLVSGG